MKRNFLLLSFLMLTSCVEGTQDRPVTTTNAPAMSGLGKYAPSPVTTTQKFACSNNEYAYLRVLSPTEALLSYKGKSYDLSRRESTSGALFAGKGAEFWNKGISAMLTVNGEHTTCNFIPRDRTEDDPLFPQDN